MDGVEGTKAYVLKFVDSLPNGVLSDRLFCDADHFRDLIRAPSFPHSEDTDGSKRTKLESMGPDGFMMFMEQDFPVLAPTAAQLWDLPAFISKVENQFGRERGFVKIILPYGL